MRHPSLRRSWAHRERSHGQAMAEFALVFPLFLLAFTSIIVLGIYVFYQAEVTNAARQTARYAAIHSSTATCPTASWVWPQAPPLSYYPCDPATNSTNTSWPNMNLAARGAVWGLDPNALTLAACWSGFVGTSPTTSYDDPPVSPFAYAQCKIAGHDPITDQGAIACPAPATTASDDTASDVAGNNVTVYACYTWTPPMAGFIFIPSTVIVRAVVTESIERQQ
jgi:TadE-like protein